MKLKPRDLNGIFVGYSIFVGYVENSKLQNLGFEL